MALEARLVEERIWERREGFLELNPAAHHAGAGRGRPPGGAGRRRHRRISRRDPRRRRSASERLLPADPVGARRGAPAAGWFNDKFFAEVSGPLVMERCYKRHMRIEQGGGPPDTDAIRAARANIRYHLAYIGWLVRTRDWLAGERLSYADLAAAAHLSSVDYLGDVPWNEDEAAKTWYARVKSRPSFRPILADALPGVPPSATYANLDF